MQPRPVVRSEVNQREKNEDSFHLFSVTPAAGGPPVEVLAVADGMGGHEHGELVSREALHRISLSIFEQLAVEGALNRGPSTDLPGLDTVAMAALEEASAQVRRMVEANGWEKAGSTVVLALIRGNEAVVANLGDSPLYHHQAAGGRLTRVTQDHTVAAVLERAGMLSAQMARHHPGRGQLEFFAGAPALPREPPVYRVALRPGDLLLLCSDGISGALTDAQIAAILAEANGNLDAAADRLVAAAVAAGETDNQTLILWPYQPAPVAATNGSGRRRLLAAAPVAAKPRAAQATKQHARRWGRLILLAVIGLVIGSGVAAASFITLCCGDPSAGPSRPQDALLQRDDARGYLTGGVQTGVTPEALLPGLPLPSAERAALAGDGAAVEFTRQVQVALGDRGTLTFDAGGFARSAALLYPSEAAAQAALDALRRVYDAPAREGGSDPNGLLAAGWQGGTHALRAGGGDALRLEQIGRASSGPADAPQSRVLTTAWRRGRAVGLLVSADLQVGGAAAREQDARTQRWLDRQDARMKDGGR